LTRYTYKYKSTYEIKNLETDKNTANTYSFINLSHGRTHYQYNNNGTGYPIVLIPGATQSLNTYDAIYDFLVDHSFKVLRFDFYGKGYSDRPYLPYDRNMYIMQLKELLDKLDINQKVVLIGHSFGGAISVCFVNKFPKRVSNIILISPVVNCIRKPLGFILVRTPLFGKFLMHKVVFPKIIERTERVACSNNNSEKMLLFMEQLSYKGYERSLFYLFTSNAMRNYKKEYRRLGKVPIKKYLLWGDKDSEIKLTLMNYIVKHNNGMQFYILNGMGHSVLLQGEKLLKEHLMKILNITKN
jgi:pimeloyl-ACP methyl ester carboxylesterase